MNSWPSCVASMVLALAAAPAFAAGDVLAKVADAGELVLTGDDLANDVQVDRDLLTRELVVRGRNGTTINGLAEFRAAGVRAIGATMGAGDDVLAAGGFAVARNVAVDLGDGNDTLTLFHVIVRGRLSVTGGAGDDAFAADAGCDLVRGGTLAMHDGANRVRIADSFVRGRLRVVTGTGDDFVEVHRNGFTKSASFAVRTGAGADVVDILGNTFQAPVQVLTQDGDDKVAIATSRFVATATVNTGEQDDEVELTRTTFDARFAVSGGGGTNKVFFISIHITANGSNVSAGGSGHSGNVWWRFVIVHVFP